MAIITAPNEIALLEEAGARLAHALDMVERAVVPGITPVELNKIAYDTIVEHGDHPAFYEYQPNGADFPFPATLCVSVNGDVVHGIPNGIPLEAGDIVGLDIGLRHHGFFVDMARTVAVGTIGASAQRLLQATKEALDAGIAAVVAGNYVGDIGHAVERVVKDTGFSVVVELGGHGVGRKAHEAPFIPNYGTPGDGPRLEKGMVLALEPIVTEGSPNIVLADDGYTYKTRDGKRAAHFEHTIRITETGQPKIITTMRG